MVVPLHTMYVPICKANMDLGNGKLMKIFKKYPSLPEKVHGIDERFSSRQAARIKKRNLF